MKKTILSILTAATMLFITGCSEDDALVQSDQQNATFQIELEGVGEGSRKLADGTVIGMGSKVDKVYYAVYETGKDKLLKHGDATVANKAASVVIPLVNGLKFDIVFFAHNVAASAFTIPGDGDLRNITFNTSLKANQETYDAFYHVEKGFRTASNTTTPVTLKRPLAQLNVATTAEDLADAKALRATVTKSKIVLKGVPTVFNARTGVASDPENITQEVEVVFDSSPILTTDAEGKVNETLTCKIGGTDHTFHYLAMAYVLANEKSALYDSKFEFSRADGSVVSQRSIPNLPLQRNYRTNITGSILTQKENFTISLDTDFGTDSEHNVDANDITVSDVSELNDALAELAKVEKKLFLNVKGLKDKTDVVITIPSGTEIKTTSITLNLLDINKAFEVEGNYDKKVVIAVPDGTDISNVTVINLPQATVKLLNGNYTTVQSTTDDETLEVAAGTTIKILQVAGGNVAIHNGGTIETITPADGYYDPIIVSVEPGGTLTNAPTAENIKVETTLEDINEEWVLTEDVTLMGPITIPAGETMTIDLNGYTLSQNSGLGSTYAMINNQGTLTITDNSTAKEGKLSFATTNPSTTNAYASNTISNYGDIIIKGGTIENTSETGGACYALDNYAGSTAKIEGGKLTATKTAVRIFQWTEGEDNAAKLEITGGEILSNDGYGINLNMGNASHAEVKISGGTITTNDEDYNLAFYAINNDNAENLKIQVSGGTFNGHFALNGVTSTTFTEGNVSITDGIFEGVICYDTPVCGFISGGTFSEDPSGYLSEGCEAVKEGDVWTINKLNSISFAAFNQALYEKNGVYEAAVEDELIVVLKDSERSYQNNKTCQFFLATDNAWDNPNALETITIKNVTFKFIDDDISNTYTSGELQVFANNMTFENCTFVGTAVSPWGAANTGEDCETASFTECTFKDLNGRYGIHQNQADKLTVTDCNFMDCERGIHTNSKTPESITITGNTFTGIGEGYGMLCLAENGDYTNATLNITGNDATGQLCLRQLNTTVTEDQVSAILENNTYETAFVAGSIDPSPVAAIGNKTYKSLQVAFDEVQNDETITLLGDVQQADGIVITDKNITIDLNQKNFTVSEGASTNNRNFKIDGSSVVTIKNVTMVAAGDYSNGAYGTVRTEGTANVTLENVKLYNYRGNGLNIKANNGTKVIINDSEVYSEYGGGIEAAGGTVELTNVKVEQKGMYTAPYNSMAISVNGGGTAIVNSGTYTTECITAEEANGQGTSHGPWAAGVLNSGGTLIIKGGTFSNDNYGENSLATAARGLILADTGAKIQIEGGAFEALKSIIDIQNNLGDAAKNPSITLSGGTFSADPESYEGLIKVAEGYEAKEEDGTWTVSKSE